MIRAQLRDASGGTRRSARGRKAMSAYRSGFFDRAEVLAALRESERIALMRMGALVRTVAQRSMRRRKKASKPGSPPSARTDRPRGGLLRNLLAFSYDPASKSVVIGSVPLGKAQVPGLMEHGGPWSGPNPRRRPRHVGSGAPVRLLGSPGRGKTTRKVRGDEKNRHAVYARLRSAAQVRRAEEIETQLYGPMQLKVTIAARPYMSAAAAATAAQRDRIWADSIRL